MKEEIFKICSCKAIVYKGEETKSLMGKTLDEEGLIVDWYSCPNCGSTYIKREKK